MTMRRSARIERRSNIAGVLNQSAKFTFNDNIENSLKDSENANNSLTKKCCVKIKKIEMDRDKMILKENNKKNNIKYIREESSALLQDHGLNKEAQKGAEGNIKANNKKIVVDGKSGKLNIVDEVDKDISGNRLKISDEQRTGLSKLTLNSRRFKPPIEGRNLSLAEGKENQMPRKDAENINVQRMKTQRNIGNSKCNESSTNDRGDMLELSRLRRRFKVKTADTGQVLREKNTTTKVSYESLSADNSVQNLLDKAGEKIESNAILNICPQPKSRKIGEQRQFAQKENVQEMDKVRETVKRIPIKEAIYKGKEKGTTKQDVYEFISQTLSLNENSKIRNDPSDDVIKKLIKQNKVRIATLKKGTGKLVMKRWRNPNQPNKKRAPNAAMESDSGKWAADVKRGDYRNIARSLLLANLKKSMNIGKKKKIEEYKLANTLKAIINSSKRNYSHTPMENKVVSPNKTPNSLQRFDAEKSEHNLLDCHRSPITLVSPLRGLLHSTPVRQDSFNNGSNKLVTTMANTFSGSGLQEPSIAAISHNLVDKADGQNTSPFTRDTNVHTPINIVEMISLPSLPKSLLNDFRQDSILKEGYSPENTLRADVSNIFGFEEYLDDEENRNSNLHLNKSTHINLHKKLLKLKHLRPKVNDIIIPNSTKLPRIFNENPQEDGKQLKIKAALRANVLNPTKDGGSNKGLKKNVNEQRKGEVEEISSPLFVDDDPELAIIEKQTTRTYSRPFKRKRKVRHNFILMAENDGIDEESSEDEVNTTPCKKNVHGNKNRRNQQEEEELNTFIKDFNEMCGEVSQYELVIE